MSKKPGSEVVPLAKPKEQPYVPIGLFDTASSRRVTTPTGDVLLGGGFMRPISRATAAFRGLDLGARDASGCVVAPVAIEQIVPPRHDSPERRAQRGPAPVAIALKGQLKKITPATSSEIAAWTSDAVATCGSRLHSRSQSRASVVRSVSRAASRGGALAPAFDLTGFEQLPAASRPASRMLASRGDEAPQKSTLPHLPALVSESAEIPSDSRLAAYFATSNHTASPHDSRDTWSPTASRIDGASPAAPIAPPAANAAGPSPRPALLSERDMKQFFLNADDCETFLPLPWAAVCIPNENEQDVATRAAVLTAATLDLKQRLENGRTVILPRSEAPIDPVNADRFSDALCGALVVADGTGAAAMRFTEGAKHIVVSRGNQFFEVTITDSAGRYLVAAELKVIFEAILREEAPNAKTVRRVPIGKASRFSRRTMHALSTQMKAACLVNSRTLSALSRALFQVVLADSGMQSPASGPVLGLDGADSTAQWIPSALNFIVYPSGDAVIRTSALFCSVMNLVPCAAWIGNAAATDPLLSPPIGLPTVIQSVAKGGAHTSPRAQTPAASPTLSSTPASATKPKPGKAPAAGIVAAEAPVAPPAIVAITVPPPTADLVAHRAPVWMPEDFSLSKIVVADHSPRRRAMAEEPVALRTVELTAASVAELQLALLLCLDRLQLGPAVQSDDVLDNEDASLLPTLFSAQLPLPCQLKLRFCRTERIDNAIAHLNEYSDSKARCGPLPSEVARACREACQGLDAIAAGPPFASLVDSAVLPGPSAVISCPPTHPGLGWAIETTRWPCEAPLISCQALTTKRSSLNSRLGVLFQVTVVGREFTASTGRPVTADELCVELRRCVATITAATSAGRH